MPMKIILKSVRRILRIKFRLGLFDQPYVEELPDNIAKTPNKIERKRLLLIIKLFRRSVH